jgi:hypothetical protein
VAVRDRVEQETSTQVEIVFTDALESEGLLALVEARADGLVDLSVDDPSGQSCWPSPTMGPR